MFFTWWKSCVEQHPAGTQTLPTHARREQGKGSSTPNTHTHKAQVNLKMLHNCFSLFPAHIYQMWPLDRKHLWEYVVNGDTKAASILISNAGHSLNRSPTPDKGQQQTLDSPHPIAANLRTDVFFFYLIVFSWHSRDQLHPSAASVQEAKVHKKIKFLHIKSTKVKLCK